MEHYLWILAAVGIVAVFWYLRRGNISSEEALADQLAARARELGPPSTAVIVYCASGMRSRSAVGILRAAGYANVRNLGSMSNW